MIGKYLILLGLGHVLGDFYFQNEAMAKRKDEAFGGVFIHALEYFGVVLCVTIPVFHVDMLLAAIYLSLAHFLIDSVKYLLLKNKRIKKGGSVFLWDQVAHVISILILSYMMFSWDFVFGKFSLVNDVLSTFRLDGMMLSKILFALLVINVPCNYLIQNILAVYKPREKEELIKIDTKAGRRIGTIERLIMLFFISINQYSALGLVLTAKSIARYDKISKDEKFAEYYLLGTLLSTLCVVGCKLILFR